MNALLYLTSAGMNESIDRSQPLSERLALGGETLLLGLGTVMLVLALLWGVLELFRVVFYHPEKTKPAEPEPEIELPPEAVEQNDDSELVAVITAAAAAYIDAENEAKRAAGENAPHAEGFRVVSFKKITKGR